MAEAPEAIHYYNKKHWWLKYSATSVFISWSTLLQTQPVSPQKNSLV